MITDLKLMTTAGLTSGVGLALAGAFIFWVVAIGPAELEDANLAFGRYWPTLLIALPIGLLLVAGLTATKLNRWVPLVTAASCAFYAGYLLGFATSGWYLAPWFGAGLTLFAALQMRRSTIEHAAALPVAHLMGTLSSIYLLFNTERYLPETAAIKELLQSFWWLATQ